MGPISPVNINSFSGASPLQPTLTSSAGPAATGAASAQVGSPSMTGGAAMVMNVMSQVSQLLENVGGDTKNDNLLRMMIALLILMVLLQETQNQGGSTSQSLHAGGGGNGGQWQFFEMCSTTISIQQTSFTAIAYTGADTVGSNGENAQAPGSQIDLSI